MATAAGVYTWTASGESIVAYTAAGRSGDAAIICSAPLTAPRALGSCEALALNARLLGERVVAPGPDRLWNARSFGRSRRLPQFARARTDCRSQSCLSVQRARGRSPRWSPARRKRCSSCHRRRATRLRCVG